MDEKEIDKAADTYTEKYYRTSLYQHLVKEGFLAGVRFAQSQPLHAAAGKLLAACTLFVKAMDIWPHMDIQAMTSALEASREAIAEAEGVIDETV